MSLLVVGSVALDDIEAPAGSVKGVLGGAASYFGVAASFFVPVRVVAVVGDDFPEEHLRFLRVARPRPDRRAARARPHLPLGRPLPRSR